jgi:hypothetical protein
MGVTFWRVRNLELSLAIATTSSDKMYVFSVPPVPDHLPNISGTGWWIQKYSLSPE